MSTTPRTPDQSAALSSTLPRNHDAALRALLVDQVTRDTATPELTRRAPAPTGSLPLHPLAGIPHRRPTRRILIGVAAAAAVVTTSAVMLLNDPTAPAAYAAWTAVPATAPGKVVSSDTMEQWASTCSDLGVGGLTVGGVPARPEAAKTRDVLIDRRGSYTYCLDVSPGTATETNPLMSISGLKADAGPEQGTTRSWSTVFSDPYTLPTGADVLVLGGDERPSTDVTEPDVITLRAYQLYGMAGPDVTGVDIVLTNGLRITATVHDGIWGAWWPMDKGDPTGNRLEVHTGAQTRVVDPRTVELPWEDSERMS